MGISVLEMIFPCKCHACGVVFRPAPSEPPDSMAKQRGDLSTSVRNRLRSRLCPACLAEFKPAASPLCSRCGIVFKSREGEDHLCGDCISTPRRFERARSLGLYEGAFMSLIHGLKYRGMATLARPLGALLFEAFAHHWHPDEIDLVLPVPLHPKRMRRRGFNQAWLLVQAWPKWAAGRPPTGNRGIEVADDVLRRVRQTVSQTGLGRQDRQRNLKGAFFVTDSARVANRRILLVDDVYTTGATVDECTAVLLTAGAKQVAVLTVARTL